MEDVFDHIPLKSFRKNNIQFNYKYISLILAMLLSIIAIYLLYKYIKKYINRVKNTKSIYKSYKKKDILKMIDYNIPKESITPYPFPIIIN